MNFGPDFLRGKEAVFYLFFGLPEKNRNDFSNRNRREDMFRIKWLWKYMGEKRNLFVIAMVLSAVTSAILVVNPMLSQKLIDDVITPQNTSMLLPLLGLMMVVQMVRLILRYVMVVLLEKSSQCTFNGLRRKMFNVLQNEDARYFHSIRTGDLMTRMTNDLDLIRHAIAWISYSTVDSIVTFAAALIYLGCVNVADSETSLLEELSLEAILAADPDYIFVVLQGSDDTDARETLEKTLLSNPAWGSLRAVREGRFHTLEHSLYNLKPNARWGEAYEKLADILYP